MKKVKKKTFKRKAGWAVSKKSAKKDIKRGRPTPKTNKGADRPFYTKEDIFLSRLASILQVPKEKVKLMFSQRAESVIRLNPLAGDVNRIKELLERYGVEMEPIAWSENTYRVVNKDKSELGEMGEYDKGLFYIQSTSSMLPAIVLEPKAGEKILDMCAAPGSKTSQIAAMTGDKAEITASDDDYIRAKKLESVLKQFHVKKC